MEDCRVSVPSPEATDPEAARAIWQYTQDTLASRLGAGWPGLLAGVPEQEHLPVSCCADDYKKASFTRTGV
eukprot:gene14912-20962_t